MITSAARWNWNYVWDGHRHPGTICDTEARMTCPDKSFLSFSECTSLVFHMHLWNPGSLKVAVGVSKISGSSRRVPNLITLSFSFNWKVLASTQPEPWRIHAHPPLGTVFCFGSFRLLINMCLRSSQQEAPQHAFFGSLSWVSWASIFCLNPYIHRPSPALNQQTTTKEMKWLMLQMYVLDNLDMFLIFWIMLRLLSMIQWYCYIYRFRFIGICIFIWFNL